ncbi:MAG: DUF3276 family protein [Cytophagales bacterium]
MAMEISNNIHSTKIRAGKRTYFVDLKETRSGGCYIVLSEVRKPFGEEASSGHQKSRIFIHPEDISRVMKALQTSYDKMQKKMPAYDFEKFEKRDAEYEKLDTPA